MFSNHNMIFVSAEDVKNYMLPPNSKILLLDREKPIFYVKTTDSLGQYSVDTYSFSKLEEPEPSKPLTKDDLDSFKQEILALIANSSKQEVSVSNERKSVDGQDW